MATIFLNFLLNDKSYIFVIINLKYKNMQISNILFVGFGAWEVVLIVAVIVLIFGGKKIPELMKGLGKGMKEFKNASKENSEDNQETEKK